MGSTWGQHAVNMRSTCGQHAVNMRSACGQHAQPYPAEAVDERRGGAVVGEGPDCRALHSSILQLNISTFCGTRWVPVVSRWVITLHKLDTQQLTDQNGYG
jgi:hypothetical protein